MSGAYWVGPEPEPVVVVVSVAAAAVVEVVVGEEGVRRRTHEGVGEREMSLIEGEVPAKTAMRGPHHRSLHQLSPHPPVASSDVFG